MYGRDHRTSLRRQLTDFAAALITDHPAFTWRLLRRDAGTWYSVRVLCDGIVVVPAHLHTLLDDTDVPVRADEQDVSYDGASDGDPTGGDPHDESLRVSARRRTGIDLLHVMWIPWPNCESACRHRTLVFFHEGLIWSFSAYCDSEGLRAPLALV